MIRTFLNDLPTSPLQKGKPWEIVQDVVTKKADIPKKVLDLGVTPVEEKMGEGIYTFKYGDNEFAVNDLNKVKDKVYEIKYGIKPLQPFTSLLAEYQGKEGESIKEMQNDITRRHNALQKLIDMNEQK